MVKLKGGHYISLRLVRCMSNCKSYSQKILNSVRSPIHHHRVTAKLTIIIKRFLTTTTHKKVHKYLVRIEKTTLNRQVQKTCKIFNITGKSSLNIFKKSIRSTLKKRCIVCRRGSDTEQTSVRITTVNYSSLKHLSYINLKL